MAQRSFSRLNKSRCYVYLCKFKYQKKCRRQVEVHSDSFRTETGVVSTSYIAQPEYGRLIGEDCHVPDRGRNVPQCTWNCLLVPTVHDWTSAIILSWPKFYLKSGKTMLATVAISAPSSVRRVGSDRCSTLRQPDLQHPPHKWHPSWTV